MNTSLLAILGDYTSSFIMASTQPCRWVSPQMLGFHIRQRWRIDLGLPVRQRNLLFDWPHKLVIVDITASSQELFHQPFLSIVGHVSRFVEYMPQCFTTTVPFLAILVISIGHYILLSSKIEHIERVSPICQQH